MADSLVQLKYRIRQKCGDTTAKGIFEPRLDEVIGSSLQLTAAALRGALYWQNWLNLVAGTEDYTKATTELLQVGLFRLVTSKLLVEKVSPEHLETRRQLVTDRGTPSILCLMEQPPATAVTLQANVRVFPVPAISEVLEAMVLSVPGLPDGTPAAVIPLSELGMRALEYRAAAELVASMAASTAEDLGVDKAVAALYSEEAKHACYLERRRVGRLQRTGARTRSWRRW